MRHLAPAMRTLLADLLRIPSVSGTEGNLTRFVAEYLAGAGLAVDLWQSTEADLAGHRVGRHLPLDGRPTLVATLRGTGGGRSLMFNAHADTVDAPHAQRWTHPPFAGVERDGVFFGRGACDVKGPMVSAIWSLLALRDDPPAGDLSLELVPGEEDCVTLGTLGSVVWGHTADASVVLEPTECQPRPASRPGVRFEITCHGSAVHGTVKWLGHDAIRVGRDVCQQLDAMERQFDDRDAARPLFERYPIARPITVDTFVGRGWQGMVCDECLVGGYLELLPADDPLEWQRRFAACLPAGVTVAFPEVYPGHACNTDISLCRMARGAVEHAAADPDTGGPGWDGWAAFNSGCEAGLRATLLRTPTLVWGPGTLAHAHAVDERVRWADVAAVAGQFVRLARDWCASPDGGRL